MDVLERYAAPPLAHDALTDNLLAQGCPVAIGVSGGKDSTAVALATVAHLDRIGHIGPRVLVHADLGRVEWAASLPACAALATAMGMELVTVRRAAGDLLDRWQSRWANNVARYQRLECVKLILPWSTAAMRFCTSEMKTDIITRALVKRYPGAPIVSVSGIRRQESPARAKAPVAACQAKLTNKTARTWGVDWHPIIDWTLEEVLAIAEAHGIARHEAYETYGSSRVSCAFCILGSAADLAASAAAPGNADTYRAMVRLESASTFAFQDGKWLGDVAPWFLDGADFQALQGAKIRAELRAQAEAKLPAGLLYAKGWPTRVPTLDEACVLAHVRNRVADVVGFGLEDYRTPRRIIGRYTELMEQQRQRGAA